jgi:hypothetical protein
MDDSNLTWLLMRVVQTEAQRSYNLTEFLARLTEAITNFY